jgi:hypothetical protein
MQIFHIVKALEIGKQTIWFALARLPQSAMGLLKSFVAFKWLNPDDMKMITCSM